MAFLNKEKKYVCTLDCVHKSVCVCLCVCVCVCVCVRTDGVEEHIQGRGATC